MNVGTNEISVPGTWNVRYTSKPITSKQLIAAPILGQIDNLNANL